MNKILPGMQLLIALSPIRQDGKRVDVGAPLVLVADQVAPVLKCGAAREATVEEVEAYQAGGPHDEAAAASAAGTAVAKGTTRSKR